MKLVLNGEAREVRDGATLAELIIELGLGEARLAVERNRQIVPARSRTAEHLAEGDQLEIVTFVGGG